MRKIFFGIRNLFFRRPSDPGSGKKWILGLSIFFLLQASGYGQNIVSKPVGFVQFELPAQSRILASMPFESFDDALPITETSLDHMLKWDPHTQAYHKSFALTLDPGEGFWIENHQTFAQSVFLAGQVVLEEVQESSFYPGLNLFGFPFSSDIDLKHTSLSFPSIHPADSWLETNILRIGRGYWYEHAEASEWVWPAARPYANPFPADDDPPLVSVMTFHPDEETVTLVLETTGVRGEKLEIYGQDPAFTGVFDSFNDWKIVEVDLVTLGKHTATWTDTGLPTHDSSGFRARYYLVARGDVDRDGDGMADARETFIHHTNPAQADTDGDGMPDGWEVKNELDPLEDDGGFDWDRDGLTNLQEYQRGTRSRGSSRAEIVVYVSQAAGDDGYDGLAPLAGHGHGPKRTIQAAIEVASSQDIVEIEAGVYHEAGLDLRGKNLTFRPTGTCTVK